VIRLEVVEGQDEARRIESNEDMLRLGRSDFNELVLSEWHVSGEHASIVLAGASYVVRDHNSTNGTRIERGGDTIDLADDDAREGELRDGDLLLLGDRERPVRIKVTIGDEPDDARIVSLRKVDELAEVEATVGADR